MPWWDEFTPSSAHVTCALLSALEQASEPPPDLTCDCDLPVECAVPLNCGRSVKRGRGSRCVTADTTPALLCLTSLFLSGIHTLHSTWLLSKASLSISGPSIPHQFPPPSPLCPLLRTHSCPALYRGPDPSYSRPGPESANPPRPQRRLQPQVPASGLELFTFSPTQLLSPSPAVQRGMRSRAAVDQWAAGANACLAVAGHLLAPCLQYGQVLVSAVSRLISAAAASPSPPPPHPVLSSQVSLPPPPSPRQM
ncbi:unnamed protein product [Pleuronectes platessa]|uniref:Uncharacterized protein n=1 Tax=Pleuronectes platessa TaxID=8262 RepID=A0A9N7YZJ8_PLEPL|nr:unnamed protein product [Pleuronectes platessa]